MRLLFLSFIVCFLCSCGNTFYIVRHAEKEKPVNKILLNPNDPPLSDSGDARTLALKERLKSENIRHIFSTNYVRTISTAKPIDEYLLDVQTQIYSARPDSLAAFISKLKTIRNGNVLIVGHSNTIDDLANQLSGTTVVPGDLADSDYDNLYIIRRRGNRFVFKSETYGVRTD